MPRRRAQTDTQPPPAATRQPEQAVVRPGETTRSVRTGADRVAELVARRSEIGEIPAVVDPARRARCEADPVLWVETYCPSLLRHRMPPAMQDYVRQIVSHAVNHAGKTQIIVPRGGGKTSVGIGAITYLLATGLVQFTVLLGAKLAMASTLLQTIWRLCETSTALGEDYPALCFPIRCLRGAFQRAANQTHLGVRTEIRKTATEMQLPTIEGSPCSGSVVVAGGAGGAIRGLLRDNGIRPQLVWLDDIATRKTATPEAARKLEEWLQADILGLAGADQGLSCVMACTRIADGDLTTIYEKEHPDWRTLSHKLVERWPDATQLWDRYMELYVSDLVLGDERGTTAHQHYLDHKAEMDQGAEVFDPLAYDPHVEASAIERAYRKLVELGTKAFNAEYQGEIHDDEDGAISLQPDEVAQKVNGVPRRTLPKGTLACVAFADVGTASKIHWTVLATGPHRVASVIDYGVYPPKGVISKKGATVDEQDRALSRALVELAAQLYGQEYRTEDGRTIRLHALWFDRGWKSKTVDAVCTRLQAKGWANTIPVKGFDSAHYWQGAKAVVARGRDVDMRRTAEGTTYAGQNSDTMKEYVLRALTGEPTTPGSISLFGSDPRAHAAFVNQLTGEKLVEKWKKGDATLYRWASSRPGAQNHYLDSTSGAVACATWYRFLEPDAVDTGALTRRRMTTTRKKSMRVTGARAARSARLAALRRAR